MDQNGDGIGDIPGILSKLDYLKDLGVETLWISPFYKSPHRDFGYDISDYKKIDPIFGTLKDVDQLIKNVHKKKMRIVFDMVLNHTSDEHSWFKESRSSLHNPKRDYYIWKKGNHQKPPNNWVSMVGKSGWNFDPLTEEYYYSNFLSFQPDLNYRNPKVKKEMFDVMRFWLDRGVDGFRLDIFNSIFKDELFRNNPFSSRYLPTPDNHDEAYFQEKKYNLNLPENFSLAKDVRQLVDKYRHKPFLIGEVSGNDETLKSFLGEKADGLNLVFQFELIDFKFKAGFFRNIIEKNQNQFPPPFQPTYVFGNHDQKRYITKIGGDIQKAKLLSLFQLTVRGTPILYYGEEIGMLEGNIPIREGLDPIAKQNSWVPDWLSDLLRIYINRDNCRTPMQWEDSPNVGFTTNKPWIRCASESKSRNVKAQTLEPSSLFNHYKFLLALRKSEASLTSGDIALLPKWLYHPDVLAYQREKNGEHLEVYLNFGSKKQDLGVDVSSYEVLYSTQNKNSYDLEAFQGIVLKKRASKSKSKN